MPDHLPVHVNRQELHDLSVPSSFETSDSFVIEVHNHGEAGRIHVHLDENLSAVASMDDTNYYIEANGRTEIPVNVHEKREVFGKLKIVSGYGAVTRWVDVVLTEPEDNDGVVVDEDLAKPAPPDQRSDQEPSLLAPIVEHPTAPVIVLALVAVLVAIAAASLFESTLVVVGSIVVVVAVLVSVGQLVR